MPTIQPNFKTINMNLLNNIKWYKTPKNLIKKYYRIKKHKSKKKRKQLYKELKPKEDE